MKEYKVLIYQEGMFSSLFLGSGKVDPDRLGGFLNAHAAQGYRVVTMERETRRMMLLWQREAFLIVLERER